MVKEQRLLDSRGKLLGTFFTESTGNKRLLGNKSQLLGSYNKSMNTTYDRTNNVVARSDQLLMLLARQS